MGCAKGSDCILKSYLLTLLACISGCCDWVGGWGCCIGLCNKGGAAGGKGGAAGGSGIPSASPWPAAAIWLIWAPFFGSSGYLTFSAGNGAHTRSWNGAASLAFQWMEEASLKRPLSYSLSSLGEDVGRPPASRERDAASWEGKARAEKPASKRKVPLYTTTPAYFLARGSLYSASRVYFYYHSS